MSSERGQATIEWTGVMLVVTLVLGGALAAGPRVGDRSFGGFLTHRLVCAVKGGCADGDAQLARAYGARRAALVRAHAPNLVYEPGEAQLPIDYRRCRTRRCADAADDRGADVHRTHAGERATVFTRVLRRNGRLYLQYWLYYPDSNTTWAGSDKAWRLGWLVQKVRGAIREVPKYPGFHEDDWEGYQVRFDPDGSTFVRVSSHGKWSGWADEAGWTRVSRGSHAGHLPKSLAGERTTTAEALRLIPLERVDHRAYRRRDPGVSPPWRKEVYDRPESAGS